MKIGISYWQSRISPVFDVSQRILVVDLNDRIETERYEVFVEGSNPSQRANQLSKLGVKVLICGAVSRDLESALENKGIEVKSLVRGRADAVLAAYCMQNLDQDRFRMPRSSEIGRSVHSREKGEDRLGITKPDQETASAPTPAQKD